MSIDFMPYVFNAAENIWRIPAGCDTDDERFSINMRIPLIAIMMFTMPEAGLGNGMTRCCGIPLTVEQVSFLDGVRQVR